MKQAKPQTGLDRRSFLKATAGAGLLGLWFSHAQDESKVTEVKPTPLGFEQEATEYGSGADYTDKQRSRYFVDNPGRTLWSTLSSAWIWITWH